MLNLKSLLRTAKERQRQEEQQQQQKGAVKPSVIERENDNASTTQLLPPPPCPPPQHPHPARSAGDSPLSLPSPADYLSLNLSRPISLVPHLTSAHLVSSAVATCYYISEWCSEDAEAAMLECCLACPAEYWVQLRGRSLQTWGNMPRAPNTDRDSRADHQQKQKQKQQQAGTSGMPAWLASVMLAVEQSGLFSSASTGSPLPSYPPPDHVLINRYEAGQGIMAHKDGPAYQPLVAILSLASHTVMHFYEHPPHSAVYRGEEKGQPLLTLLLEPRSLLLFTDELYTQHFHCIHEQSDDTLDPRDVHNWQLLSSANRRRWEAECGSDTNSTVRLRRSTRYSLTVRASRDVH